MKFQFEITDDYLNDYKGEETFRAKVYYEIQYGAILNVSIDIPFRALLYLNNIKFAEDVWKAIASHAAPLLEYKEKVAE